ncbi:MAG: PH domain-containing protein, partial [Myxococcota bacterium]|nr:PH domain-containing protein [Myxococcota bacterium]
MDNISLEEEEYIIASDNASLAREFFPKSGTLMLTNVRILFLSRSKWGPPISVSIDLDKIDLIDHKHWLRHSFHIHAEDNKYRFFGKGGHRIYERLLLRRKALSIGNIQGEENIQAFREIIYIQGDIQVFVTGQLTAHAQIFFTSKKLRVDAYYSFLKRYPPFECTLEEVSSFSYNLLKKSLDIQTYEQTISIMGDLIPKLYLLLIAQKEGGVSQTWNAKGITFNRGILFIKGIASLSHKHFLFCPTGSVDSFAGAQEVHIPIKDVHRIDLRGWPERNITLSYGDQTFSFSTPNIKRDFRSLAFNIVQF